MRGAETEGTKLRVRILNPMPEALAANLFYSDRDIGHPRDTIYLEYM